MTSTFTFFISAEHAFGKAVSSILNFGKKSLPALTAALPQIATGVETAATVAELVLPADAALIAAVNNASQTVLAKSLVAVSGANALAQAEASGTLTIAATVDEVNALKALVPAATQVVGALGLSHALVTPAAPVA